MTKKDQPIEETSAVDEQAEALRQLAQLAEKAASDRENRSTVVKEAEAVLSKLRIVDFPELAESPIVQSFVGMMGKDNLRPGETRNRGTLAEVHRDWTMDEINQEIRANRMGVKQLVPAETIDLIWNGVKLRVVQDEPCEIPDVFWAIYMERRRALGQAAKHEAYLLGHSDTPPDPNWQTPESALVRGWSLQGRPYGRPSGTLTTGKIVVAEEQEGA